MRLTIGIRTGSLAFAQAAWVSKHIHSQFPDTLVTIRVIGTAADQDQQSPARPGAPTASFVRELEQGLMTNSIDLAVHNMKDVPTRIPESLDIGVTPAREDPRDALVIKGKFRSLAELPPGSTIGTCSLRRQAQLRAARPDLKMLDIRGNVEARLQRLAEGPYDAIILACCVLDRLELQDRIGDRLDLSVMLPAAGQGALALETRKNDHRVVNLIAHLNHRATAATVSAERAFMRRMGVGRNAPIAVHAAMRKGFLAIEGLVATPDGSKIIRDSVMRAPHRPEESGLVLAEKLLAAGGKAILKGLG